jgi:hypothetical protein
MQVKSLDGYLQNWQLTGHFSHAKLSNKSSLHINAREVIKDSYPTLQILEEVPIPLRKNEILYLDFYLPLKKICIEVHGEQHYKFVSFYHNNQLNFLKSQKRDREKKEWCELNGIKYIVLPYDKKIESWKEIVTNDNAN